MKHRDSFLIRYSSFRTSGLTLPSGWRRTLPLTALCLSLGCGNVGIDLGGDSRLQSHGPTSLGGTGGTSGNDARGGDGGASGRDDKVPDDVPPGRDDPRVDAGALVDAGRSDDAGSGVVRDAGTRADGGSPPVEVEAGTPDAGRPDGGVRDAGNGGGGDFTCSPDCNCEDSDRCDLSCEGALCAPSCGVNSNCQLNVAYSVVVDIQCAAGATCGAAQPLGDGVSYTCRGEGNCVADCQGASTCQIACLGTGNCTIDCGDAESCFMECGDAASCVMIHENQDTDTGVECSAPASEQSCEDGSVITCNETCAVLAP